LPYQVRLMCHEDIPQVTDIDREAFPTMLPYPNYWRELENKLAQYIVACNKSPVAERYKGFRSFITRVKSLFYSSLPQNKHDSPDAKHVVGFAGFWLLVGEAHIINIAVREQYRRQGIGELLLISIIELTTKLNASAITLEVRFSNTTAQNLYRKYGFVEVGMRRGYYTDNKEDAILMTAGDINSELFQARFQQLKKAHSQKIKGYHLKQASPTAD